MTLYIHFKDEKPVYSFNSNELTELRKIGTVFKDYGNVNISVIKRALSTKFAIKIIPLLYSIRAGLIDASINIPDDVKDSVYNNTKVYTEYGLLVKSYLYKQNIGQLHDAPKYLLDEINKYQEVEDNWRYRRRIIIFKQSPALFENYYDLKDRPYDNWEYDANDDIKYWDSK